VQEKLQSLLQAQPRTIRPKNDAKLLRNILLDCSQQQQRRQLKKQQRRVRLEQTKCATKEGIRYGILQDTYGVTIQFPAIPSNFVSASSVSDLPTVPSSLQSSDQESLPNGIQELGTLTVPLDYYGDNHGDSSDLILSPSFKPPSTTFAAANFEVETRLKDVPCHDEHAPSTDFSSDSMHMNEYTALLNPSLAVGFDSDFGISPFLPSFAADMIPSTSDSPRDLFLEAQTGCEWQDLTDSQLTAPSQRCTSVISQPKRVPVVNSAFMGYTSEDSSSFLSMAESCYDFDAAMISSLEAERCDAEHTVNTEGREEMSAYPSATSRDQNSELSCSRISDSPSAVSRMSTLFSDMSLTTPSTSASCDDTAALANKFACPIIMPGSFPGHCWQHIRQNELRRCSSPTKGQKENNKGRFNGSKAKLPCYAMHTDIVTRILENAIKPSDLHETDSFGNSILHISAAMLAPKHLISLIKLGASTSTLNNAGQTFLHLIKPELLDHCDELCSLLELLSEQSFSFAQLDHLGQSPLHLLVRPWIPTNTLLQIIVMIGSLPIHSQVSSARDCFGYTISEELNRQESSCSWSEVDRAILSLTCEASVPIRDSTDLVFGEPNLWRPRPETPLQSFNPKDAQPAQNYENHPNIENIDDLVQYEQHVDHWRTILTGKQLPWFEDSSGRNGLHCLAEASLVTPDKPLPHRLLAQLQSWGDPIHDRAGLVNVLLATGVNPNNYDKEGNTPLMSFITHDRAPESDQISTQIMNSLLKFGGNIYRRNRLGETALHLAVKLGRRAATEVLLAAGANVHARTQSGLGVLELGYMHAKTNKQNGELFAQIMLCLTLSASFGAVAKPTPLDEWSSQPKLSTQPREKSGFNKIKTFIVKKIRKTRSAR
jgi:hypothetical protein